MFAHTLIIKFAYSFWKSCKSKVVSHEDELHILNLVSLVVPLPHCNAFGLCPQVYFFPCSLVAMWRCSMWHDWWCGLTGCLCIDWPNPSQARENLKLFLTMGMPIYPGASGHKTFRNVVILGYCCPVLGTNEIGSQIQKLLRMLLWPIWEELGWGWEHCEASCSSSDLHRVFLGLHKSNGVNAEFVPSPYAPVLWHLYPQSQVAGQHVVTAFLPEKVLCQALVGQQTDYSCNAELDVCCGITS